MGLKKQHDFPDLFLFFPGRLDHANSLFSDARHCQQLVRVSFDQVQGGLSEFFDNPLCHDRSDTLDQARAQVFLNAVNRGRHLCLVMGNLELLAKLGMAGPFSLEIKDLTGGGRHHVAHGVHEVCPAVDFKFDNAVAVLFVGIGDSFDLAFEVGKHLSHALL